MGYGIDDRTDYYAFDGMYCNYNTIKTQPEVNVEEIISEKLKQNFLANLLTFESNLSIRNYLVKKILINKEKYMIRRYAKKENLPIKYSIVAEQKEALDILIKNYLKQIARINLNENIRTGIQKIIQATHENKENYTAYQRVGFIRAYIYETVKKQYGLDLGFDLPSEPTRCVLSACRLHFNLFDIRKNNLEYLKNQIALNQSQYNIEMKASSLLKHKNSNKKMTPHWKAQHMKTLLYFNDESSRKVIDAILSLDVKIEQASYLDKILQTITDASYLERLIKHTKV